MLQKIDIQTANDTARIYSLKITLLEGPVTGEFARSNPEVSRVIEIRGSQTLRDLHEAIFRAFDRSRNRGYEFQMEGGTRRAGNGCFLPVSECRDITGAPIEGENAAMVTIDSLALTPGDSISYWFGFSSVWRHRIVVVSMGNADPGKAYPYIAERIGDSPSQNPDWDRVIRV